MGKATRSIVTAMSDFADGSAPERDDCDGALASRGFKRFFDFHFALVALIVLLPLLLCVVALLLIAQGRPVIIRHNRVGKDGTLFPCFKFRTMVCDADRVLREVLVSDAAMRAEWDEKRKLRRDPRVTPLGRALRQSSVDEIPQLINVLRGEMSVVGPRPIVSEEVSLYGSKIQHYCKVRPGLTGAWQIGGRSDLAFAKRVELDTAYVNDWSFKQDMTILLRTLPVVLKRRGSY